MARPTKYDPVMCQKVVPFMAQGFSQKALAGHLEISEDTLYAWIKQYPEFSESVKDGSTQSAIWWEKVGMTGMVGKIAGFNATTWIFNMKNRHGWTDRTETNGRLQVSSLDELIKELPSTRKPPSERGS